MAPEFGNPIDQLPIVPPDILKKHRVYEPFDGRFRAAARLLQALWRKDRELPIGSYVGDDGKRRKLGNLITDSAGHAGGNFLTPAIASIARRPVIYREFGALIDQTRLATNLLSSMPLTFNLLAPWVHEPKRATGILRQLIPDFSGSVLQTLFETSPARGDQRFTGDFTAFDALVRYSHVDGRKGFVAFEIKYSESMGEPVPKIRPRCDELTESGGLFINPAEPSLRSNPLEQLWREHLLAQSMISNGLFDEGYFVLIAPRLNYHTQNAADAYRAQLRDADRNQVRFVSLPLEDFIDAVRESDAPHADALYRRYCDFWLVDGEMELNAPPIGGIAAPVSRELAIAKNDSPTPPRFEETTKSRGIAIELGTGRNALILFGALSPI